MEKITFECEVVTPMFMGGAAPNEAELRPPSIKGALRFWWRAMKAEDKREDLIEEEEKIFGGTRISMGKQKGKSSSFKLKVNPNIKVSRSLKDEYALKNDRNGGKDAGILYLLYSTVLQSGIRFIKPGSTFKIEINFPVPVKEEDEIETHVFNSLWLSIYLGGFGSRSRRFGGNIKVLGTDNYRGPLEFCPPSAAEIEDWYKQNLSFIKTNKKTKKYSNLSEYNIYIPSDILDGWDSWRKTINRIGSEYLKFRKNKPFVDRLVFGLPITGKSSAELYVDDDNVDDDKKKSRRRASPLIFHITKSKDNKFIPVLTILNGMFMPSNSIIKGKVKNRPFEKKLGDSDFGTIKEFIKKLGVRRIEL